MKTVRFVLNLALALALPFIAVPSRAQDTPQQDGAPDQPAKKITRVKQGGAVMVKILKVKIEPVYPQLAKEKGIQGTVRLHAIVGKDGSIQQLEVISGQPLLVEAALTAVRQSKYRITYLNGEAVEVDTVIDIIFSLNA